jgi:hypothetical protein
LSRGIFSLRVGRAGITAAGCGPLLLLLASCEESPLPAPPNRLTSGIVIYQDAQYGGSAAHVTVSLPSLRAGDAPCVETTDSGNDPYYAVGSRTWSNCISSLRVARGWKAILYAGYNFTDEYIEVTSDVPDLRDMPGGCGHGFNDCVSSIRVSRQ